MHFYWLFLHIICSESISKSYCLLISVTGQGTSSGTFSDTQWYEILLSFSVSADEYQDATLTQTTFSSPIPPYFLNTNINTIRSQLTFQLIQRHIRTFELLILIVKRSNMFSAIRVLEYSSYTGIPHTPQQFAICKSHHWCPEPVFWQAATQ